MNILDSFVKKIAKRKLGFKLLSYAVAVYDRLLCSAEEVAYQAKFHIPNSSGFTFSVGIAHYNRGTLISLPLRNLLNHPAVSEVVIVDDGSSATEFYLLQEQVRRIDKMGIVKIHRRVENRGALVTKMECVEKCASDWVLLLDSDNTALEIFLDGLASFPNLENNTIYCSSWAYPYFCFEELCGIDLNFQKASELISSGILKKIYLLNDGNFFVNKKEYLNKISALVDIRNLATDVLLVNYRWLSEGGTLRIIPNTKYIHRVDNSSFWSRTADESKKQLVTIYERITKKILCDESFLKKLKNSPCN